MAEPEASDWSIPSPDRLISCVHAYRLSAAIRSGLEIELFTAIAEGHVTAAALAARCGADARGVRILADFLVTGGFLTKQEERYGLSEEARHYLDRRSPRYLGAGNLFAMAPVFWEQYGRLTEIVRQGGARAEGLALEPNQEMWVRFARDMGTEMAETARLAVPHILAKAGARLARPLKVLDIAAGHGMFGITLAKAEETCQVVSQDWPRILEVTKENAIRHGVADRLTTLPGDVMEVDLGGGYDIVLVPNLIHYMGREAIMRLLKKVRGAMKRQGVIAIVEYAPNDDRVWPPFAQFALFSLVTSAEGDAYTVNEILGMCWEAGFTELEYRDVGWERVMLGTNMSPTAGMVVTGERFPGAVA